ncbi:MAG: hypothetical protein ACOYOV_10450 [Bacteroidales bacterium]
MGSSKSYNLLQTSVPQYSDATSLEDQIKNATEKSVILENDTFSILDAETEHLQKINFTNLKNNLNPNYIKKPVISIANELPVENLSIGDRYFMIADNSNLSIAEWNGTSWIFTSTKDGDCIYSYAQRKFIIRTLESYETSSVTDEYETDFNTTESVTVRHNLNRYPSVLVLDSTNRQIITQVTYTDRNTAYVSWTGETSGKIVCN